MRKTPPLPVLLLGVVLIGIMIWPLHVRAIVQSASTVLREAPLPSAPAIQTLPQETQVTLLGQAAGAWVRVQPNDGVVPGWAYGPDVRALDGSSTLSPLSTGATPPSTPSAPIPSPTTEPLPRITQLESLPPTPLPVAQHTPISVTVTLIAAGEVHADTPRPGRPTPPPVDTRGIANVRVQLVTVFGDVLVEAVTPGSGQVVLRRNLPAAVALLVRIPALGVQTLLDRNQPTLTIVVPKEATP